MFKPFNILFIVNLYARDDIFNLSNAFRFKDWILKDFTSDIVYKFQGGKSNSFYYGDTDKHLSTDKKVRSKEQVGIDMV